MRKDVHLTAVKGGPDRLLETSGRDAKTLCGKVIVGAKCIGRLDVVEMELQTQTILLCSKCVSKLSKVWAYRPTYVYGVLRGVDADRFNSDATGEF